MPPARATENFFSKIVERRARTSELPFFSPAHGLRLWPRLGVSCETRRLACEKSDRCVPNDQGSNGTSGERTGAASFDSPVADRGDESFKTHPHLTVFSCFPVFDHQRNMLTRCGIGIIALLYVDQSVFVISVLGNRHVLVARRFFCRESPCLSSQRSVVTHRREHMTPITGCVRNMCANFACEHEPPMRCVLSAAEEDHSVDSDDSR